jgi:hypothetical protein
MEDRYLSIYPERGTAKRILSIRLKGSREIGCPHPSHQEPSFSDENGRVSPASYSLSFGPSTIGLWNSLMMGEKIKHALSSKKGRPENEIGAKEGRPRGFQSQRSSYGKGVATDKQAWIFMLIQEGDRGY